MDCEHMIPRMLTEMPQRIPVDGTFELTVRCNLHCKMCLFRHDDSENAEIMKKELTAEQWIDMAKQAAEAGTFSLLITGGEPMLRPDFCEIWEGIYKLGFILELYTNATLVTPKIMETLRKYPPHRIGITMYGASEETYEKTCGDGKAYGKMLKGIQQLSSLPSMMTFRTTIIKDNYCDVHAMEQYVEENFHKTLVETRVVTKAVRGGCADVESCRLNPKDNIDLLLHRAVEKAEEKVRKQGYIPSGYDVQVTSKKESEIADGKKSVTLLGCNAGMESYTISWDGKMLGCQLLGRFSRDVKKETFKDAWNNLVYEFELPELCEKCCQCKHYDICEACPATRYAETGDMGGCIPYLCKDVEELLKYVNRKGE